MITYWELRAQQGGSSGVLQAQLTCALDAIRTHRDACDTADIEPRTARPGPMEHIGTRRGHRWRSHTAGMGCCRL